MRVLSFQNPKVIEILKTEGIYKPDLKLSREKREYSEDIKQLGGSNPIWCFSPKGGKIFNEEYFNDGCFSTMAKCEMSLMDFEDLKYYSLLEIEIKENKLLLGLTHNASSLVKVFSVLTIDMLKAVYKLDYSIHWAIPKVIVKETFDDDIIFKKEFIPEVIQELVG